MKFDDKYKTVNEEWKSGGMFQGKEQCDCASCNEPTVWIEPSFLIHICSEECYNTLWKEYKKELSNG